MSNPIIELGLQPNTAGALTATLREVIDQSLSLLRELFATGDGAPFQDLGARIDACRVAVASGTDAASIQRLAADCFTACRKLPAQSKDQDAARQKELASLIALIHEAVTAVADDADTLQSTVAESTERFAALARLEDLGEIKRRLMMEVVALKQVTTERQKSWSRTLGLFKERVAGLEQQLAATTQEASTDALTQLANRGMFDRTCHEWVRKSGAKFALGILDIDNFKAINDTYGHNMGDQVLVAAGAVMRKAVRADDLVARLGGDEFVVMAMELTGKQAEFRLQAIGSTLAAKVFESTDSRSFQITMSSGVAEFSAGDTAESLLQRADEALYEAKHRGKNCVVSRVKPLIRDLRR